MGKRLVYTALRLGADGYIAKPYAKNILAEEYR